MRSGRSVRAGSGKVRSKTGRAVTVCVERSPRQARRKRACRPAMVHQAPPRQKIRGGARGRPRAQARMPPPEHLEEFPRAPVGIGEAFGHQQLGDGGVEAAPVLRQVLHLLLAAQLNAVRQVTPESIMSPDSRHLESRSRGIAQCAIYALAFLVPCVAAGQDSIPPRWRTWAVEKAAFETCRTLRELERVRSDAGEYPMHRDAVAGKICQAGPGPWDPGAWIIDAVLFCPESNPDTWRSVLRADAGIDLSGATVAVTRDSAVLRNLHCATRSQYLFPLTT